MYGFAEDARRHLSSSLQAMAALEPEDGDLPRFRCSFDPWMTALVEGQGELPPTSLGDVVMSMFDTGDHDVASYFIALETMTPPDRGFDDAMEDAALRIVPQRPVNGFEATFDAVNHSPFDAVLCAVSDAILVSLPRHEIWMHDRLAFATDQIEYGFDHVACPEHAAAISERKTAGIRTGLTARSFWQLRDSAFPNLLFGPDVEGQMAIFSADKLPLLFRRFADLDARVLRWRALPPGAAFPEAVPEIAPESTATMKNYTTDRTFRSANGSRRVFEDHVRVDSLYRVHLFRDTDAKTLEIGYVGRHLPNVTSAT